MSNRTGETNSMSSNDNSKRYLVLRKFFSDSPRVVESDKVIDAIENDKEGNDREWYASVYYYNEEQAKLIKEKNSTAGVRDVRTDKLVFDFDCESNPDNARKDAVTLCNRLKQRGIGEDSIEIYYSGNKGFHVIVPLTHTLTPKQTQIAAGKLAADLSTFDASLYDAPQILRVPWTKNKITNLYKVPVSFKDLNSKTMGDIKKIANDVSTVEADYSNVKHVELSQELTKEEVQSARTYDIIERPKHWSELKWNLLNAVNLKPEERHHALMVIAATCRGIGYPEDMARALCLTFDEKFTKNTGKPFVEDLESNVLRTVYGASWNGGQYSIENDMFLQQYADRIGLKQEEKTSNHLTIDSIFQEFETFSRDFEKNIIKTGIEELDSNSLFLTSTHNGILGQPGSGKTSFLIQWLEYLSMNDQHCFFYSLDMAESIIIAKLIQRVTGLPFKDATSLEFTNPKKYEEVKTKIKERFKNVTFVFTAGTKVENIEKDILSYERNTGNKVRFLAVDYLECLQGPYSDSTANTGFISQQLKDVASKTKVCSVILLQTQKSTGGGEVSEPIHSMKKIKGSSVIEQSASVILTLWREGYSPKYKDSDNFMSFAIVKNRFGSLWTDDFEWNGPTGSINGSLIDEQKAELAQLRQNKLKDKLEGGSLNDEAWK